MSIDQPSIQTLVLGVGNLLLSDEGVGIHVVRCLVDTYRLPDEVQVLDGGTLGMDLLYYMEGVRDLLIVDAVQSHKPPGSIVWLAGEDVPAFLSIKMSPHQIGVPDMLYAARLQGTTPPNVVLWGVEPDSIELGLEMSETVAARVPILVEKIVEQLRLWGHQVTPL